MAIPKLTLLAGTNPVEGVENGVFTITLDSPAPTGGLTIKFNTTGSTATFRTDYKLLAGANISNVTANMFTIAAGAKTATLNIVSHEDKIYDSNETVSVNLIQGTGYSLINSPVTFANKVDVATGSSSNSVAVGDFNNDGKTDFAVANSYSNTVSVLLRNATNTGFDAKVDVATGSTPKSVAVGDFNKDGKTDFAVANLNSDTVSVFLRNATNTGFDAKVDVATGSGSSLIAVGDFNNDGKADFAVANQSIDSDTVSVLLRNAKNTGFAAKVDYAIGYPYSVAVGDFNNDGKDDLAVTSGYNTVSVLLRNATNTGFDEKLYVDTGSFPSVAVGDFNNDGKADFAVVNYITGHFIRIKIVSVFLRNAANTGFDAKVDVATGSGSSLIAVGDFNNDGKDDLAVDNGITVSVLLRNATNTGFDAKVDVATGFDSSSSLIAVGDFNNDGKDDLAVDNLHISVLLNTSTASASLVIKEGVTLRLISTNSNTSEGNALVNGTAGDVVKYAVTLGIAPVANHSVIVNFSSSDTTEGTVTPSLTFTSANWNQPQTLVISGVDDLLNDGNVTYTITPTIDQTKTNALEFLTLTIPTFSLQNTKDIEDKPINNTTGGNIGTTGVDYMQGNNGNDQLYGNSGYDEIKGGLGNDQLYGDQDNDYLYGQLGNDTLFGGTQNDQLYGNEGNDTLNGGTGTDTMIGGAGNDRYYLGYDVIDVITDNGLSTDIDTVVMPYQLSSYTLPVGIEKGIITVGVLASSLNGNDGNNALMGNDGNNTLNGGAGSDLLFGGLGDDVLNGGMGNDALSGGSGKDTFLFNTAITENVDRIADFKPADNTIKLENLIFAKLTATGVLDVSQFVKGTAALDSNDYVIYNTTTGAVTYDSDGSGADQGVIIVMLGVNLAVTNTDFVVI